MNSVAMSNEVLVVTYYNALYDLNDIRRSAKLCESKVDALIRVIDEEVPQLKEDEELRQKFNEGKLKIEEVMLNHPRAVIVRELHDTLLPFVDNLKAYVPDEYQAIVDKYSIPIRDIEGMGEVDVSIVMIRQDGRKERVFTPEQVDKMREELIRNFDIIYREITNG